MLKTKTKFFSAITLWCLMASVATTSLAYTYPTLATTSANPEVSSASQKKDLSVLWERLSERLRGVGQEVKTLVATNGASDPLLHGVAMNADTSTVIHIDSWWLIDPNQNQIFSDISTDTYKAFIDRLATYGVISTQADKFYPQNYLRVSDAIKIILNIYRQKIWIQLDGDDGLTSINFLSLPSTYWLTKYINTAYQMGILQDFNSTGGVAVYNQFITKAMLRKLISNMGYQFPGMVKSPAFIEDTNAILTRSEGAYNLVMVFDLPVLTGSASSFTMGATQSNFTFSDIIGHPFELPIEIIGRLGIANTQTSHFYPDNYLHRYDFITLLVNALAVSKGQTVNSSLSPDSIADVASGSLYAPFIAYADNRGLLDYLLVAKRGENFLLPNQLITRNEVYHILGQALGVTFDYDSQQADNENVSRGEFAKILVDAFGFQLPSPVTSAASSTKTDSLLVIGLKKLVALL